MWSIISRRSTFFLLTFIIILAGFIRLYALNRYPIELLGDEVDVGYQAYSLATTGRDYTGQFLPTYIHSFSEWRAPLLMYATIPSIIVLGPNAWGVRTMTALFGIASVALVYYLVLLLTGNKKIGLCGAFILAITPWHIHYSRAAYEVSLLFFLYLLALISFFRGLRNARWFLLSAVCFSLTIYTYSTAAVFTPLLLGSLILLHIKSLRTSSVRYIAFSLIILFVMLTPYGINILQGKAGERFSTLSIFNNQQAVNTVEQERNNPKFPNQAPCPFVCTSFAEKVAHNKLTFFGTAILTNYSKAFSPEFLFLNTNPYPHQQFGSVGQLLFVFAFLIALGIYSLIREYQNVGKFLLLFGLLAPIPASLTTDGANHATRLFMLQLPFVIAAGFGLWLLLSLAARTNWGKLAVASYMLLLGFNLFIVFHSYFAHMPVVGYKVWQYGYQDSLRYINQHKSEYDRILVTMNADPPLYRTLLYLHYPPRDFQKQFTGDKPRPSILFGFSGYSVGKLYFVKQDRDFFPLEGLSSVINNKTLYLISQEHDIGGDWDWRVDPPKRIKVLHTTLDPWSKPLYYVVTGT